MVTEPDSLSNQGDPVELIDRGMQLLSRFKRSGGALPDILEAIAAHQKAVGLTPIGDPELPGRLRILGTSFRVCYNSTGNPSDISSALEAHRKAVELSPPNHPNLPAFLNALGTSLTSAFERTGAFTDLADAIAAQERAIGLTPDNDHKVLPGMLNSLGCSLIHRFEHEGDPSDIVEAVNLHRKAVQLTPPEHAADRLPSRLHNLGNSLRFRFEQQKPNGSLSDLDEAIATHRKAVELTPPSHVYLPFRISNLGVSLRTRFNYTGNLLDIAEAISCHQKAVVLAPSTHPNLPDLINNLGDALVARFRTKQELSDINLAIDAYRRAVSLTLSGDADLPVWLKNLGSSYYSRFIKTGIRDDLAESLASYRKAVSIVGPPSVKLEAATRWATLSHEHSCGAQETIDAFDSVIRLISLVAGLEKTIQDRHRQLQNISGLSLQGAAAACALGRPDKAIEWLEQGRCLVWTQLNQLRSPLEELQVHDKDLAQRILKTSKELENAGSRRGFSIAETPIMDKTSVEERARSRIRLAKEWEDLLTTVRNTIPDFSNFLRPLPFSSMLRHLPESGLVIIINVHEYRCDAIALEAGLDKPVHVPLPNFTLEKARRYLQNMERQLESAKSRTAVENADEKGADGARFQGRTWYPPSQHFETVLAGLWEAVVKPIFDALAISPSPNPHTRVWWCPTGPLSSLPLHAAGRYGLKRVSVFDYAVSSYIPNVTSLLDRVKKKSTLYPDTLGLFLMSQPDVPGLSSIPGTSTEVLGIQKQAVENGVKVVKLEGKAATKALGLQYMENSSSIHFACHAVQDIKEPLQSGFFFHDGRLSLSEIAQSNIKDADLAFLSACQTSLGDMKLSEEAVHLAAGMLAAGYRGVVATMWSIGDREAPEVAKDFYEYLWTRQDIVDGREVFKPQKAAYALHHAIQKLMKRSSNNSDLMDSFHVWVPYVHFGL